MSNGFALQERALPFGSAEELAEMGEMLPGADTAEAYPNLGAVVEHVIAEDRYGRPILVVPRLGQGGFRVQVLDAYQRRCVVTGERTLPALDAAHIKPFAQSGPHRLDNGLLLRKDLHALFDAGYVTVTPQLELRVSRRIREEFENGRDYYALDRRPVTLPSPPHPPPSREYLEWHGDALFRG